MPEELLTMFSKVGTTFALCWGKSPRLTLVMLGVMLANQRLTACLLQLQRVLTGYLGLDNTFGSNLYLAEWGIQEAVDEFEDMRVNAKEPDVMHEIERCTAEKERQQVRKNIVPSFLQ